jgi:hypothetical protein
MKDDRVSVGSLILVPSLITLGFTLLRLVGELRNWSPTFFSKEPGGGASLVGISWLVPVFGIYFAYRLVRAGDVPKHVGIALASAVGGVALVFAAGAIAGALHVPPVPLLLLFGAMSWVAVWLAYRAWPGLGRVLLAYAFAARIPVAIVMLVAMYAHWGTHYDVANPNWPEVDQWSPFMKWLAIGALPQFTIWIAYTLIIGLFFGAITVPLARRSAPATA